jgi:ferrous iron transport protein A
MEEAKMPLSLSRRGQSYCVRLLEGTEKIKERLTSLGFTIGSEVSVISESDGNLIVNVKNSRIAVSKAMAHKIFV